MDTEKKIKVVSLYSKRVVIVESKIYHGIMNKKNDKLGGATVNKNVLEVLKDISKSVVKEKKI